MKQLMFLTGAAVGYVMGSRAGRERYEQIKKTAQELWAHPSVQSAAESVREQASLAASSSAHKAGSMAGTAKQKVNERLHRDREEEVLIT
ncbi:YtxH domain-containing protein [Actinocorallia sp. B10E7]|uniref:YtxH domain-containing protein n=1 Tax=Actinocorallia sp. B10E7 TaxID=3153558 RepID=UPI00325D3B60